MNALDKVLADNGNETGSAAEGTLQTGSGRRGRRDEVRVDPAVMKGTLVSSMVENVAMMMMV